jgi:hypothetical protein
MNKLQLFFIGIFIGASLGYGVHWGMTEHQSPASQCLRFGRFCEPQEQGGLCFECKAI